MTRKIPDCPRCGHPIVAKGGHQTNPASREGECSYCRQCHEARIFRVKA